MKRKAAQNLKSLLLPVTAAALVAAVFLLLWYQGCFLPGWINWKEATLNCGDVITNTDTSLTIRLRHRRLTIFCDDEPVWSAPDEFKIQDFQWGDINADGSPELMLLCWKIGSYGNHHPFWIEKNDHHWSQHIYIYQWDGTNISPLWMASDIGMEVQDWHYDDHGYLILSDRQNQLSSWAWLSWGLERVDTTVTFAAVGDVLIHEPILRYGLEQNSFDFLYEHVRKELQNADIAIMNQETIYTENASHYSDFPKFGTPLSAGEAVQAAGFDVVTAANNHALDQGMEGINTTYRFYEERNILCLGIQPSFANKNSEENSASEENNFTLPENDPVFTEYTPFRIIRQRRIRFALLNYTYGLNGQPLPAEQPYAVHTLYDEEQVRKDIRAAREAADMVIVFVHWGTEYEAEPDEQERYWANVFLEENVDVVIGTHPHVLQPYEWMTGSDGHQMLIYYSLGNFISAQDSLERIIGGMAQFKVEITLNGCEITEAELLPTVTHQSDNLYTVYFLKDYTEELAKQHRLGITMADLLQYTEPPIP